MVGRLIPGRWRHLQSIVEVGFVECSNCGSPLEQMGEVCGFCGNRSTSLPQAEVPVVHQRGDGRTITKTYDDSLRSISEGVEISTRVHERDLRRYKVGLVALILALSAPMLFVMYVGYETVKPPGEFSPLLDSGIEMATKGAYSEGHELILTAVQLRPDDTEGRLLLGAAKYAEFLEKSYLDDNTKDQLLDAVRREMHFILQVRENEPRANLFMGFYRYEVGEISEAKEHFRKTMSHLDDAPDGPRKVLYGEAAKRALEELDSSELVKLNLYSEADDSLTEAQSQGIKVPFGR